ncbi:MAG: hypothetical protein HYT08_02495 [Candidatus Levybacteria bacterium]|nr:hypothetical protein [Candidatus Levybacteria bacterium]
MSKQIGIIIGIIVLVLIGGAVAYTQLNKSSQAPQQPTTVGEEKTQSSESMNKGSFKSLLGMGQTVTCNVSYSVDQMESKGTVYVAGKKMRGDFTVKTADSQAMDSHMITDEMYMYSWSSANSQGVKFKIDEALQITPSPGAQSQTAQLDQEVDYKCSSWTVDNSKFTPPSNIKFTDMSSMMNQMKTQPSGATQNNQSAICDQIEDPTAKASCLKAVSGQ